MTTGWSLAVDRKRLGQAVLWKARILYSLCFAKIKLLVVQFTGFSKMALSSLQAQAPRVIRFKQGPQAHRPLRFIWKNTFDPWAAPNFREA